MSRIILAAKIATTTLSRKVKHNVGFPAGLENGTPQEKGLHLVLRLLIEQNQDGVFLYRVSNKNEILADTWHASIDDAIVQANYEYGEIICEWRDATDEEALPIAKR